MPAALARVVLVMGVVAGLAGCSGTADLAKALASDPNAVCVKLSTPWGSSMLDRNWGCEAAPAKVVVTP
jgi:hypothetical protein